MLLSSREKTELFFSLYPNFFESAETKQISEAFEELYLPLDEFDEKLVPTAPSGVSFGFYTGEISRLKAAVEQVEPQWVRYFEENDSVFCGFCDDKIVSFCIADNMGNHSTNNSVLKIGGAGCVGTLPEYRRRGIGLAMVGELTKILAEQGFDISYIHYTAVGDWYKRLGYKSLLWWDKNGILP